MCRLNLLVPCYGKLLSRSLNSSKDNPSLQCYGLLQNRLHSITRKLFCTLCRLIEQGSGNQLQRLFFIRNHFSSLRQMFNNLRINGLERRQSFVANAIACEIQTEIAGIGTKLQTMLSRIFFNLFARET